MATWVAIVLPISLSLLVGVQGWMVREILQGIRFRAATAAVQGGLADDVERLGHAIERLERRIDQGFARVDRMLAAHTARRVIDDGETE